jgi:hypothetical protein
MKKEAGKADEFCSYSVLGPAGVPDEYGSSDFKIRGSLKLH